MDKVNCKCLGARSEIDYKQFMGAVLSYNVGISSTHTHTRSRRHGIFFVYEINVILLISSDDEDEDEDSGNSNNTMYPINDRKNQEMRTTEACSSAAVIYSLKLECMLG